MESELQRSVRELTRELEAAREACRQSEQILAMELDAAQRLQRVATQLISAQGTAELYEQILDAAVAVLHADFASIQMVCPERGTNGELRLIGHPRAQCASCQTLGLGERFYADCLWRGFSHSSESHRLGCPHLRFHGWKRGSAPIS